MFARVLTLLLLLALILPVVGSPGAGDCRDCVETGINHQLAVADCCGGATCPGLCATACAHAVLLSRVFSPDVRAGTVAFPATQPQMRFSPPATAIFRPPRRHLV